MSWLYSRALVEEYLAGTCSGGEQSVLSSANPMLQAFLPSDRMTAFSRPSRFGMTFAPSTESLGAELLTWFLAASRARTSALPAKAQESTANAPACGDRWRELSVRYDRATSSWRTHRSLWDEDLSACSLTLPKWGSMRDGVLLELLTLERRTAASDVGLWPTPNVPNGGRSCAHVTDWRGRTAYHNGKKVQVGLEHAARYWPTPKANDAEKRGNFDTTNKRNGLPAAAKSWPTPVASMSKGSSPASLTRKSGADRSSDRLDHAVMASDGGQLNPMWVEWLMGWPLGWTDLKPLETDKRRNAQRRHGGF